MLKKGIALGEDCSRTNARVETGQLLSSIANAALGSLAFLPCALSFSLLTVVGVRGYHGLRRVLHDLTFVVNTDCLFSEIADPWYWESYRTSTSTSCSRKQNSKGSLLRIAVLTLLRRCHLPASDPGPCSISVAMR